MRAPVRAMTLMPHPTLHAPRHRAVLVLVVEESDVLKARREILRACGGAVDALQSARIRGTSRLRLRVSLDEDTSTQELDQVMRRLGTTEFNCYAVL